jgi:hypothetical protein
MKTTPVEQRHKVDKKTSKHLSKKPIIEVFEPIRTRVANW